MSRHRLLSAETTFSAVWISPDFFRFWLSSTISAMGTQVSVLALPLTAIVVLHASPLQMGTLLAAEFLPNAAVGLLAGVWVDRHRRRPILVATELIPAVALATVPLAAVAHTLTLAHLYVVAVIAGAAASVSNAAFWPYLTTLVHADKLIVANSRHEVSRSLAEIGGPSLGGVLVQLLGPPVAVAVDALSFLISGLLLHANTDHERIEHASASRGGVKDDIVAGMVLVLRDPLLRVLTVSSTLGIVCFSATVSILVLYMTRDLGHSPGELGIVFAAGGLGALAGALMASRVSHRLGIGPTVIGAEVAIGSAGLLIPLAGALPAVALPLLAVALLVRGATLTIYNVTWNSLIQTIVPQDTQGRVYASSNALIFSLQPVGALGGGFLGQTLGLQATLLVTAVAWSLVFVFPLASPLRDVRDLSALRH